MLEQDLELEDGLTLRVIQNEDGLSLDLWGPEGDEPLDSVWYTKEDLE